jgi:hypothetical protein
MKFNCSIDATKTVDIMPPFPCSLTLFLSRSDIRRRIMPFAMETYSSWDRHNDDNHGKTFLLARHPFFLDRCATSGHKERDCGRQYRGMERVGYPSRHCLPMRNLEFFSVPHQQHREPRSFLRDCQRYSSFHFLEPMHICVMFVIS